MCDFLIECHSRKRRCILSKDPKLTIQHSVRHEHLLKGKKSFFYIGMIENIAVLFILLNLDRNSFCSHLPVGSSGTEVKAWIDGSVVRLFIVVLSDSPD